MGNRRQARIKINNSIVVVSDEIGPSRGVVSDMSLSGIQISQLPNRPYIINNQLSVILSKNNKLFRMNVTPKWQHEEDGTISMGVKITNTPLKWNDFILLHELKADWEHKYL